MDIRIVQSASSPRRTPAPPKEIPLRPDRAAAELYSSDALSIELKAQPEVSGPGNSYGVSQYVRLIRKILDSGPGLPVTDLAKEFSSAHPEFGAPVLPRNEEGQRNEADADAKREKLTRLGATESELPNRVSTLDGRNAPYTIDSVDSSKPIIVA